MYHIRKLYCGQDRPQGLRIYQAPSTRALHLRLVWSDASPPELFTHGVPWYDSTGCGLKMYTYTTGVVPFNTQDSTASGTSFRAFFVGQRGYSSVNTEKQISIRFVQSDRFGCVCPLRFGVFFSRN